MKILYKYGFKNAKANHTNFDRDINEYPFIFSHVTGIILVQGVYDIF